MIPENSNTLFLEGNECLRNVSREFLESEGYTVVEACNDYEGLPQDCARLAMALPPRGTRYLTEIPSSLLSEPSNN